MVLTLPQEFMAKPNQTETLEKDVLDNQRASHELVTPEIYQKDSGKGG